MKRKKTEEVPIVLDATLPPELENEVDAKITTTESNESVGASVLVSEDVLYNINDSLLSAESLLKDKQMPNGFSEPQPSVPVEVVIVPVVREKIEVDKLELYKMIYCLGTRSTYQHIGVSLVNKIGAIFGISQEDGWKLWEEIKNFQSKQ